MSAATLQAEVSSLQKNVMSHDIRTGMVVRCQDGLVGRVIEQAPMWAEQPTHLVVETEPLVQQQIMLPLHWVAQVTNDQVVLRVRRRHISPVQPCITDDLLEAEVREELYSSSEFQANDAFLNIAVMVRDHQVTLSGNVRTLWRVLLAETIALQVRGVRNVQNELVGDDELEDAVLHTLRRDTLLHLPPIHVQAVLGQITLSGQVRTAEEATHALLLVRHVRGVRSIQNQLVVNNIPYRPPVVVDGHVLFAGRRTVRT